MDLERKQALHNGIISSAGNTSASLDPLQIPNDANDVLTKGAMAASAGRTLGLSEEETLSAVSRQFRRQQQRAAYKNRNERQAKWEQSQKTLQADGFQVDSPETDVIDSNSETEIDRAFGFDQSEFQNFTANDRGYETDDDGLLVRSEYETKAEPMAPKSALKDSLDLLRSGTSQFGYSALPGAADVEGRIEQSLGGYIGPDGEAVVPIERDMQRAAAIEMIKRDLANSDPEVRQANDFRADAEAQGIARDLFTAGGAGSTADEAIGRIAEIRKLGGAGALASGEMAQVIRSGAAENFPDAIVRDGTFFDPNTNNPIAIQGPEVPPAFRGANTPNTAQNANAPQPQNAATWMQANLPSPREGGRVFNDYPQVDITLETTNFANRLRALKGFGLENVSPNIRNLGELDRVIKYVASKAQQKKKQLYRFDAETGKNVPSSTPGAEEVMNFLRMNQGDQQRLANAMFQLEMASDEGRREAYQSRTGGPTKGVTFDAPEAVNDSSMQSNVARIPKGSTIDTGNGRESIVTLLSQLEGGPSVQKPFIGQIEGEKPRVNRFKPGGMGSGDQLAAKITMQARARAKGKPVDESRVQQNVVKARLAEEREARDQRKRSEQMSEIISYLPPIARRTRIR